MRLTTRQALNESIGTTVEIAGRILSIRDFGKLAFYTLQDESGKIQLVAKEPFSLSLGDIVSVVGERFKTKAGEESVLITTTTLLTKATLQPPANFYGLQDKETRFRKRYLDMMVNRDVFERFKQRSKIITLIRTFLNKSEFTEVETPVLQPLYGGTNARPFKTRINTYAMDMYLRIAPELYLKRLLVGGYEKIYEIGKNFRNEGVDQTHNPEFTMMEWYEAYTDYQGTMDRAEQLLRFIANEINNSLFSSEPWPRIRMTDLINQELGLDVEQISHDELVEICTKRECPISSSSSRGQLIFALFESMTQKIIDPTWIIDYPKEVSPFAKEKISAPGYVERFELYINGKEICDGWTEITDPIIQRERFENEQKEMRAGNEEAHPMDTDFIEALSYGMPPTGGIGIGIDRLVMLFTDTWSIREIIHFPIMKPTSTTSESESEK